MKVIPTDMKEEIAQRLSNLREIMQREHLDAFIFPSTDPHNSEYVPDRWKGREWISGFNGSAGTAVVTMHAAALWTDSRYFIAAEQQLAGTEFVLMRERVAGTPTIAEWLGKVLSDINGATVGVDGMVNTAADVEALIAGLRQQGGITVRTNFDPLAVIWTNQPPIPTTPIEVHSLEYAGESTTSKLSRIRMALRSLHADGMLVSALDDIAWTLNLRGSDVHCNPVFVSYLLIDTKTTTLFINDEKLTPDVKAYLTAQGVQTAPYNHIKDALRNYNEYNILLDPNVISYTLFKQVRTQEIVRASSPIPAMKAIKNEIEVEGFRRAMIRDGVALVKFLRWLQTAVVKGQETEISVAEKLTALRAEQSLFRGISFDTIAGYEAHGAIVHYEATPETDVPLKPRGFLLLDSGAQYQDGTTDITRTIALGELTEEQREVYTLVLKGHIQLELAKFPSGASGTQIDALAREAMWRKGFNFLHGTGHGVGSFLNVHEGPHQIRMEYRPAPLLPFMTVTDEPGLYFEGKFGVRIENILLIKPYVTTPFGEFLQMEPLTLCPIDTAPIVREMLLNEEVEWLNGYHQYVFDKLSPYLQGADLDWLRAATQNI
jgi:peptidase, M24 family